MRKDYPDIFYFSPGNIFCLFLFILYNIHSLAGQTPCTSTYATILGSTIENESGYSLALSNDKQYLYVGGLKSDSAIILKVNLAGQIIWTRSFDVVPNKKDFIYRVLMDSEGMLGVSGIAGSQTSGGTIFVFRYDPDGNKILWSKELTSTSLNFNLGMIEMGPGGNYLVSNNPSSPNEAELVAMDRSNGKIITGFSKHYDLGSSETFLDMEFYQGQLYLTGRFSDGGSISEMRNTLVKMNPTNGNIQWSKLGHLPANQTARLYGMDIIIARDTIYSIYLGDDNGNSVDNTQVFIQKTTLGGQLIWIKQYEFPGTNDWVDEIVHSENGLVVLGRNRIAPSDIILFKIDYEGKVLWGKRYDFTSNDNAVSLGGIQSQMVESNGQLFFTAVADNAQQDMILVQTDVNGEVGDNCTSVIPLNIPVITISNPNFYLRSFIVFDYIPQIKSLSSPPGKATSLKVREVCSLSVELFSTVDTTICEGMSYAGYTLAGQYVDSLNTVNGCDSIRTINLAVIPSARKTESKTICEGDAYLGYLYDGIYSDTFASVSGCDSIRTLQLSTIPRQRTNEMKSICKGSSYQGYTADGIYQDTFVAVSGCDSIRTLELSLVNQLEVDEIKSICADQQYLGYTQTGIYVDTFTSMAGCDSIRSLTLDVLPQASSFIQASVCDGLQFGHHQPGVFIDTLITIRGCDSVRTLELQGVQHYIPNVFSPNGDQINDVFEVFSFPDEIEVEYFTIFDRFGNMMYETSQGPIHWLGTDRHGKPLQPGVFAYALIYRCGSDRNIEHGDITLVK